MQYDIVVSKLTSAVSVVLILLPYVAMRSDPQENDIAVGRKGNCCFVHECASVARICV